MLQLQMLLAWWSIYFSPAEKFRKFLKVMKERTTTWKSSLLTKISRIQQWMRKLHEEADWWAAILFKPIIQIRTQLPAPTRGSKRAAGLDLTAAHAGIIHPGGRALIATGVFVKIPRNHVGLVCSRSGLAAKSGVFVLNAPGVIDEDYRGELKVILFNGGTEAFSFYAGDRVAQLLLMPCVISPALIVDEFDDETERGENGFGSSGR